MFKTVDEHVAERASKSLRKQRNWSRCYLYWRQFVDKIVLTFRFPITLILVALGVLFQQVYPDIAFYENSVYKWLYFFGGTFGVLYVLEVMEWLLYWVIAWLGKVRDAGAGGSDGVRMALLSLSTVLPRAFTRLLHWCWRANGWLPAEARVLARGSRCVELAELPR